MEVTHEFRDILDFDGTWHWSANSAGWPGQGNKISGIHFLENNGCWGVADGMVGAFYSQGCIPPP